MNSRLFMFKILATTDLLYLYDALHLLPLTDASPPIRVSGVHNHTRHTPATPPPPVQRYEPCVAQLSDGKFSLATLLAPWCCNPFAEMSSWMAGPTYKVSLVVLALQLLQVLRRLFGQMGDIISREQFLFSYDAASELKERVAKSNHELVYLYDVNLLDDVWKEASPLPPNKPIRVHELKYAGVELVIVYTRAMDVDKVELVKAQFEPFLRQGEAYVRHVEDLVR
ncbi:hypothetical protein E3N88_41465 [Mikania micrantha]|uniref:Uncharacterized protein n=1 Tax=Mikania micrantha TaxID=192012 RepID=A0A5N6LSR2_9ASTR|nr:hypothetical protein E3N88_41465 [Mikania micrantha]